MCNATGTAACHLTVELGDESGDGLFTLRASCQDCLDAQIPLQAAASLLCTADSLVTQQRQASGVAVLRKVLARDTSALAHGDAQAKGRWVVREVDEQTRRSVKAYAAAHGIPIAAALGEIVAARMSAIRDADS